ncbi:MFS transporter [Longispora albida]|uniref:MFS transporter n=1 Tax=Longispora albida TaxID=203523 RepID=UPI0003AA4084|nr:MFS transporter [Longispora albida]
MLPPPGTPRILLLATLVNTLGNGAYLATSTLFLTRSAGLTAAELGIGLGAAAVTGIVLSTPLGYLADRLGPKGVQIGAMLGLAACYAGLLAVTGFWTFTLLACLIAAGDATVRGANGAMIASAVPPEQRLRLRAMYRTVNNGGIAIGALLGGVPLMLDSRAGYVVLLLGNSVSFVAAAAILTRARAVPPVPKPADGPRMVALRDKPFLTFALVDGLMASMYNEMLSIALPLWLVAQADGPLWLVPAALLVNTIGCVTLQLWASKGVDTPQAGIRTGRRGALVVGASCVLFGLTAGLPSWAVIGLVLAAAVVHVIGEIWSSTATWAVVYGLAPDNAQGQYQGAYTMGRQIGNMIAPPVLTMLVVASGTAGWVGLGVMFAVCGLAYQAIVQWGLRTRPAAVVAQPVTAG